MAQMTLVHAASALRTVDSVKFTIQHGEVRTLHLYEGYRRIRVISGCANLSYAGNELILTRGQEFSFHHTRNVAVIMAKACRILTYELLSE